jgi:hypothetical protein
MARERAPV